MPIIQTCIFGLLSAALLWGLKEDRCFIGPTI